MSMLLFFIVGISKVNAQKEFVFKSINTSDDAVIKQLNDVFVKNLKRADTLDLTSKLRLQLLVLFDEGYLAASFDSIIKIDSTTIIWSNIGSKYKLVELKTNDEDEGLFAESGVRSRLFRNDVFNPSEFNRFSNRILSWCENNGYPFASLKLDSVLINQQEIKAKLLIDKGPLILLDTSVIKGNAKLSKAYLINYLSIKPGTVYHQDQLRKISNRLRELPFVTEARTTEIEFSTKLAKPILYLQQKKSSQFNGVIGLQQDRDSKVYLTGDIDLRLHNAFNRAEYLGLNWSNPQPRTQDLRVKFMYPFLFNTPFGLDLNLTLFKRDTIFLEFFRELGIRYALRGNNSFKVFFSRKSSDLISTSGYSQITTLPPYADVTTNNFGIGAKLEHLDYRLNPRQGYTFETSIGAGTRTIKKNSKINSEVYDSLELVTTQYRAEGNGDVYIPFGGRGVLNAGFIGGYIESPSYFENELFRFGGLRSLRGFNEQSLLASQYIIGKMEVRFILEQNSYLFTFVNSAYYENRSKEVLITDTPYGAGAGITFDTKLGIFSFTYAVGSEQDQPLLFRNARIHFGLINFF